jgi:hypothetical protein
VNKQRVQFHLVLKEKWYDMIASGDKKEEYREIKPYWTKRLMRGNTSTFKKFDSVIFKCGYNSKKPDIEVAFHNCEIRKGVEQWGAEPEKLYYVISFGNVISIGGVPVASDRLAPQSYWGAFKAERPEEYNVSKIEAVLENFAYYLTPFIGPHGEPHAKKVKTYLDVYSEYIEKAEKDVVIIAFWVFFNGMVPFAVKEVFRKGFV